MDPATRGDPESPLRWTAKSAVNLSSELSHSYGIRASDKTVGRLLKQMGYSLQATKKTVERKQHPDRNAQFEHINKQTQVARERGPCRGDRREKKRCVQDGERKRSRPRLPQHEAGCIVATASLTFEA